MPKDKADKGDLADIEQAQRCISESHPADIGLGERTVIGALASRRRQQAKVCIAQLLVSKKNLTASDKQWALEQARAQGNGKSGDEAKYWQLVTRVIGKRS